MEDRSSRRVRTLATPMAPSANQVARVLVPMMARSTKGSNQRPDTLMQDRTSADPIKVLLQRTAGPYIGSSASDRHAPAAHGMFASLQKRTLISRFGASRWIMPKRPPHRAPHLKDTTLARCEASQRPGHCPLRPQKRTSERLPRYVRLVPCVDGSKLARLFFTFAGWSVQPCVRPIGAIHMTAGHNAFRGS